MKGEIKVTMEDGTIYQANIWILFISHVVSTELYISKPIRIFIDNIEVPRPIEMDDEK